MTLKEMSNEDLYQYTLDVIRDLFSDTSVSKEKARENLEALKDEINSMLDSLEE